MCNQYCIILLYIVVQGSSDELAMAGTLESESNSSIKSDMSNFLEKEVDPGKSLFYCMSQFLSLLQHN